LNTNTMLRLASDLLLLLAAPTSSTTVGHDAHSCTGFYFRQLAVGVVIARPLDAQSDSEAELFALASRMKNFVYVFGDLELGVAAVIDGAWDIRGIERLVNADGLNLTAAIATHFHWDHIGTADVDYGAGGIPGIRELAALPSVKHVYVPRWEIDAAAKQTKCARSALTPLDETTIVHVGRFTARFTHTPGHSPGSVCIAISERSNQGAHGASSNDHDAPLLLVTGDTLFPGSCGRLDLPGSDPKAMYDSILKLRTRFADDLTIYPGHSYGGKSSTIGREKRGGLLRPMSRAEWTKRMIP
jgi:glyoxylase-like metal-dependent hydrolase (beta-lactamase superfamily II)